MDEFKSTMAIRLHLSLYIFCFQTVFLNAQVFVRQALSDQRLSIASLAPPPVLSMNHLQQNGKDKRSEKKTVLDF